MSVRAGSGEQVHGPLALKAVVARVCGELVDLGRSADRLQVTISLIVADSPSALGVDALVQLQAADALSQRLDRLAQLAGLLEAKIPRGWTFDADAESDGAVAHALSHLTDADGPSIDRAPRDEGDCEIF